MTSRIAPMALKLGTGTDHAVNYDEYHKEYVPLSNAWSGHVVVGVGLAPFTGIILWILLRILHVHPSDFLTVALAAVLSAGLSATIATLLERPFVVRAAHPAPGGLGYASASFLAPPLAGFLVGILQSPQLAGCACLAISAVEYSVAVWAAPWKRKDGREEVREKMEKTRQMTQDLRISEGFTKEAKEQLLRKRKPRQ